VAPRPFWVKADTAFWVKADTALGTRGAFITTYDRLMQARAATASGTLSAVMPALTMITRPVPVPPDRIDAAVIFLDQLSAELAGAADMLRSAGKAGATGSTTTALPARDAG
jgi:hypothetical protein